MQALLDSERAGKTAAEKVDDLTPMQAFFASNAVSQQAVKLMERGPAVHVNVAVLDETAKLFNG